MVAIVSSAPGKVILFGEHAVVHGITAVAAALSDLRIFVELNTTDKEGLFIHLHDIKVSGSDKSFSTHFDWDKIKLFIKSSAQVETDLSSSATYVPDATTLKLLQEEIHIDNDAASQGVKATVFLIASILPQFIQLITQEDTSDSILAFGGELIKGLNIHVRSVGLPIGAGLGSSAAFSVALSATLIRFIQYINHALGRTTTNNTSTEFKLNIWKNELSNDTYWRSPTAATGSSGTSITTSYEYQIPNKSILENINKFAYASEVVIHGTPSGLDNTTSCFGGALKFSKRPESGGFHQLSVLPPMHVLLTNTKVPRRTSDLVAKVGALYSTHPEIVQPIFNSIEAITMKFLELVAISAAAAVTTTTDSSDATSSISNDSVSASASASDGKSKHKTAVEIESEIGTLMSVNHGLLCALGVSHPALSAVVDTARTLGGLHSKLTGAGGGGCAVTLIPTALVKSPQVEMLNKQFKAFGFEAAHSSLGGVGVKWHT